MMTVNIRIELSGLDKARMELEALLNLVGELETGMGVEKPQPKVEEKPKATRKPRTAKTKAEVAKPIEEAPKAEEKVTPPKAEEPKGKYTETDVLSMARETGARLGDKSKVKDTISLYGSKISAVKPIDYEALINELKAL